MKLITLNIWGGHIRSPLLNFIQSQRHIDVFCLQEVYHRAEEKISSENKEYSLNILDELHALLPDHVAYFRPVVNGIFGIGMLVRNTIEVHDEGEVHIHHNPQYPGKGPTHSRNLQWLRCTENGQTYTIINVHGLWNGLGKTDSQERLLQSQRIRDFLHTVKTPKIVCGDFNLRPDTESMKIIEDGMNNLIRLHNISSTRTSLYPKPEKFADYILTSNEIGVHSFKVLPHEVSDHSPLFLEFM